MPNDGTPVRLVKGAAGATASRHLSLRYYDSAAIRHLRYALQGSWLAWRGRDPFGIPR
jgi:hypothetical protein